MLLFLESSSHQAGILPERREELAQTEQSHIMQDKPMDMSDGMGTDILSEQEQARSLEKTHQENDEEQEYEAEDSFQVESLPLAGRTICIDPGHQSRIISAMVPIAPGQERMMPNYNIGTVGAATHNFEYAVVLETALELEKALRALGAKVVLTRASNDELVGNLERTQIAAEAGADITISLHCDGHEDGEIHGLSVLHPGDKYIKDSELLEKSRILSQTILKHTVKETKTRDRGLSPRNDLIIFNYSKNPVVLIEMGFLTNPEEDRLLNSEEYRRKLIDGIIQGVLEYFKLY